MGGASVRKANGCVYGVPYISSSKIAEKKASIPNQTQRFCKDMIEVNQSLWQNIDEIKGEKIVVGSLSRANNLLDKYKYDDSIVEVLE
jgi:hypothetical protein